MPDVSFLISLGIHLPELVAGFFGGLVNCFVFQRAAFHSIAGSLIVGALTANYLFEIGIKVTAGWFGNYSVAFVIGLAGMAVCKKIFDMVARWKPAIPLDKGTGQ